ncbi:MFS transporter [Haladaptatus sp. W1]|uniref:MFS transporter n=1 Tax=Haladaptatus sp. W1 TaxID=1897478 RepID=UPI0008499C6C|nr:MFS transporter [Haladaptatus sp. W1]ODR79593.1 MFS transporter [Haladaptatus sp. W1]
MQENRAQFYALYLTRFASGFGFITLAALLPTYLNVLDPQSGIVVGLFVSGLTAAQSVAVIPLAWSGDRYDKRTVLLFSLVVSIVAYAGFPLVESSWGFIAARALQGVAITGTGLITLALVGELSTADTRANHIGKANAARFAASILGTISATALYERYGFDVVFGVIVALLIPALLGVLLFVERDDTRIEGFPFADMALNRKLLTLTSFRAQYAVAVTMVRTWIVVYAGVEAAKGGLAYAPIAVGVVLIAEKFTNMLCQPFTGRLSDDYGRALFVFVGGGIYGLVALVVPSAPVIGQALSLPAAFPVLGALSPAFLPLVGLNALLGVADSFREPASMALFADEGIDGAGVASSFGVRELVWRPGSILAPILAGVLMTGPGIQWVFYVGGIASISGVLTFFGVLSYSYGSEALTEW